LARSWAAAWLEKIPLSLYDVTSVSKGGDEFEPPWPVARTLHFVLQVIKQAAEFRRVLLGAHESNWPFLRRTEVRVQEAVQFNGCALKPSCAPRNAAPRHFVAFLIHHSWAFLVLPCDAVAPIEFGHSLTATNHS
jgi:hypothetical protein